MSEQFCSGCQKYRPSEEMINKRLKSGGIRRMCKGCFERAKLRSNSTDKPTQQKEPEET
jgi:hypothetical protein